MRGDDGVDGRRAGDERIDAALRRYSDPGEIPEARVALAGILERARHGERRVGLWRWSWAAAGVCGLLLAAGSMWMLREPRMPEIGWVPRAPGVSPAAWEGGGAGANEAAGTKERAAKPWPGSAGDMSRRTDEAQLPKLAVFPTPAPLTPEEQALMRFAEQAPAGTQHAVLEAQKHLGDPITIAKLRIRPLDADETTLDRKETELP